jgi:hypothetical protein
MSFPTGPLDVAETTDICGPCSHEELSDLRILCHTHSLNTVRGPGFSDPATQLQPRRDTYTRTWLTARPIQVTPIRHDSRATLIQ